MVSTIEASRPAPVPTHERLRQQRSNTSVLPVLIGVLLAVAFVVLVIVLLMHFNGGHSHTRAVWDQPRAPVVHPTPISLQ